MLTFGCDSGIIKQDEKVHYVLKRFKNSFKKLAPGLSALFKAMRIQPKNRQVTRKKLSKYSADASYPICAGILTFIKNCRQRQNRDKRNVQIFLFVKEN